MHTIQGLVARGLLDTQARVLVVAGDLLDRDVFRSLGFGDVTITNIDRKASGDDYAPFKWERQDAEALEYADEEFEWAVVSAGLHHCRSPHRGLLELYRVAGRGLVALEARDSLLVRAATRVGVVDAYELPAVAANAFRAGGVRDTAVPNYVYRWTEREVEKTIASYAPHARHEIVWFHELEFPLSIFEIGNRRRLLGRALQAIQPAARAAARIVPRQANLFGFAILKPHLPHDLQPWLRTDADGPAPEEAWIRSHLGL